MIRYLDKTKELGRLEELFDLLYGNMNAIAPAEESYEMQKRQWVACIGEALTKDPRQVLLIYAEGKLAGFCMYYINNGILMIEELQLRPEYQRTAALLSLYRHFRKLSHEAEYVECFAEKRNSHSRRLIAKWGLEPVEETPDGSCIHYRGAAKRIFRK